MTDRINKHLQRGGQQGSAMLWAILAVAVVGSGGYYMAQRANNEVSSFDASQASEQAEVGNISNMAVLKSLTRFPGASGPVKAKDPNYRPYIYVDPYIAPAGQSPQMTNFRGSPDPYLWDWDPQSKAINVSTYNPRSMSKEQFASIFSGGAMPARVATGTTASAVTQTGVAGDRSKWTLTVSSTAVERNKKSRSGMSNLLAELEIPPPPPPACDVSQTLPAGMGAPAGFPNPMYEVAATNATRALPSIPVTFSMVGFGVFDQAVSPCGAMPPPAGANSIRNSSGAAVGNCVYDLAPIMKGGGPQGLYTQSFIPGAVNDPFDYYVITFKTPSQWNWSVGQSWAGNVACGAAGGAFPSFTVRVRKPPQCWFDAYPITVTVSGGSVPYYMRTRFAYYGQVYSPTNGWAGANTTFPVGYVANHFNTATEAAWENAKGWGYSDYPMYNWMGSVSADDGQSASCGNSIHTGLNYQFCQWHGRWIPMNGCMTAGSYDGFEGWTSFQGTGAYVDYGSVWECKAFLYHTAGCQGAPAYLRSHPGCFTPETEIRVADGSLKPIADIKEGDFILNPITKKPMRVKRMIAGDESKDLVEYQADFGRAVTVTSGHPVPTTRGTVKAAELTPTDQVLGADGQYHALLLLRSVAPAADQKVWNIEIDTDSPNADDRMLEANGFVVTGDFVEQAKVEGVTPPK